MRMTIEGSTFDRRETMARPRFFALLGSIHTSFAQSKIWDLVQFGIPAWTTNV